MEYISFVDIVSDCADVSSTIHAIRFILSFTR